MMKAVIEISLSASFLIAALLLCAPLLAKRYSTKWRYWVWLLVCLRLLVPVNFSLPSAPVTFTVSPEQIAVQTPVMKTAEPIVSLPDMTAATTTQETADAPVFSLTLLLTALWLAGMAMLFLWHLSAYLLFLRSVKRYATQAEDATQNVLEQVKERMGIDRRIPLLIHPKIASPMLFGFLHPTLLLPRADYEEGDLAIVLTHELLHFKRRDLWYKAVLLATSCVHWFNPLVHLMVRAAERDIEASCDEQIVRGRDEAFRRQYGEMLLRAIRNGAAPKTALSTSFYGGVKGMKNRFIALFDQSQKRRGLFTAGLVVTSCLLGGLLISCTGKMQPLSVINHTIDIPDGYVYYSTPFEWNPLSTQPKFYQYGSVSDIYSRDGAFTGKVRYDITATVGGTLQATVINTPNDANITVVKGAVVGSKERSISYDLYQYNLETIAKITYVQKGKTSEADAIGSVVKEKKVTIGKASKKENTTLKSREKNATYSKMTGTMTLAETTENGMKLLQYTYTFPIGENSIFFQFYSPKAYQNDSEALFAKLMDQVRYEKNVDVAS